LISLLTMIRRPLHLLTLLPLPLLILFTRNLHRYSTNPLSIRRIRRLLLFTPLTPETAPVTVVPEMVRHTLVRPIITLSTRRGCRVTTRIAPPLWEITVRWSLSESSRKTEPSHLLIDFSPSSRLRLPRFPSLGRPRSERA